MTPRAQRIAERELWLALAQRVAATGHFYCEERGRVAENAARRQDVHIAYRDYQNTQRHDALGGSLFCLLMALECMECEP